MVGRSVYQAASCAKQHQQRGGRERLESAHRAALILNTHVEFPTAVSIRKIGLRHVSTRWKTCHDSRAPLWEEVVHSLEVHSAQV